MSKILLKLTASQKKLITLANLFYIYGKETESINAGLSVRRDHPSNWIIPSRFIFSYEF